MKFHDGETPIRVGVSACLLGQEVRYDGGHKRDRFLTNVLDDYVEWVPVCPEMEAGLGVPRPAVRLVQIDDDVRMIDPASGADHTRSLERATKRRLAGLGRLELCGFVLKRDSPSCGMERVKLYREKGMPRRETRGLFAGPLMESMPSLPIEEEGRLNDAMLRENFIERIFAYRRLRNLFKGRWTPGKVVAFHTAHKLQVMAHSPDDYRKLGRLVAGVKGHPRAEFRDAYEAGFMAALAKRASRGRNTNVLQHMAGYLRDELDGGDRAELSDMIHDYRKGLVPLVVPLTLLRHHARRQTVEYLLDQVYLEPHPKELMLRNHV